MERAIDKAINNLNGILTEATEGENSVCYVTENDAETLQVAINIMRKYRKIEEIVNHRESYLRGEIKGFGIRHYMKMISEVVNNG